MKNRNCNLCADSIGDTCPFHSNQKVKPLREPDKGKLTISRDQYPDSLRVTLWDTYHERGVVVKITVEQLEEQLRKCRLIL
jgi:hypothetical protein